MTKKISFEKERALSEREMMKNKEAESKKKKRKN